MWCILKACDGPVRYPGRNRYFTLQSGLDRLSSQSSETSVCNVFWLDPHWINVSQSKAVYSAGAAVFTSKVEYLDYLLVSQRVN